MAATTLAYSLILREAALEEKSISDEMLSLALTGTNVFDRADGLIVIGPHFGAEPLEYFSDVLAELGLVVWDDFFEASLDLPDWIEIDAQAVTPK